MSFASLFNCLETSADTVELSIKIDPAFAVLNKFDFSFNLLFTKAISSHHLGEAIMAPGGLISDPVSAISLGLALMFGTAGLPHILMRFFTVRNAKEARNSVFFATSFIGYFYILTFVIGFGAIVLLTNNDAFLDKQYTVFGKVVEGMEFVDKIKRGDENNNGSVSDPDKIISFKSL